MRVLSACPRCRARVVVPVDWHEHGEDAWSMALRCGECGAVREVIATNEETRRYGFDAGVARIAAELVRVEREHMAAEARAFAEALERDLIDAGDFDR